MSDPISTRSISPAGGSIRSASSNQLDYEPAEPPANPVLSVLKRVPRPVWMSLLLVALTLTTFGKVVNHLFVHWDDNSAIVENPDFSPPTTASLARFWKDPLHGYRGFYVPITYTIWWVAAHIDRMPSGNPYGPATLPNPAIFHGLNLAFHTAGAVLVFLLLRKLVGAELPALIGASVFALHPLQADPVCWASSMYTPLSSLFAIFGILLYLRFSDARLGSPLRGGKQEIRSQEAEVVSSSGSRVSRFGARAAWLLYAAALLCYVLALLTKATIIMLPVVVAVLEVGLRGRRVRSCWPLAPWLVIALAAGLLTRHTQLAVDVYVPPIWLRPLVATDALAFYLWKLALPIGLIPDYGHSPRWALAQGWIAATWLLPAIIGVYSYHLRRRFPWMWVSGAVFVAGLLPTLGLIPFDYQFYSTVADRYVYFSMLGPALAAAFLMRHLTAAVGETAPRRSPGFRSLVAAQAACLALALLSRTQATYWTETRALFGHTLEVNPNSMIAHRQLGFVMLLGDDPSEAEAAIDHYRASLRLFPDDGGALSNLGLLLTRQNRPAEAVEVFRRATMLRPNEAPIHYNLGNALVAAGLYDESVNAYARAIQLTGGFFDANMRLADALAASGQAQAARAHYRAALKTRPGWPAARVALQKLSSPPATMPAGPPAAQNAGVNPRE